MPADVEIKADPTCLPSIRDTCADCNTCLYPRFFRVAAGIIKEADDRDAKDDRTEKDLFFIELAKAIRLSMQACGLDPTTGNLIPGFIHYD